jgi:hypothetical protein
MVCVALETEMRERGIPCYGSHRFFPRLNRTVYMYTKHKLGKNWMQMGAEDT